MKKINQNVLKYLKIYKMNKKNSHSRDFLNFLFVEKINAHKTSIEYVVKQKSSFSS